MAEGPLQRTAEQLSVPGLNAHPTKSVFPNPLRKTPAPTMPYLTSHFQVLDIFINCQKFRGAGLYKSRKAKNTVVGTSTGLSGHASAFARSLL